MASHLGGSTIDIELAALLQAEASFASDVEAAAGAKVRGGASPREGKKMRIVAHRGSSHTAPENTLASIGLAFEQGASGVEFDIQQSADGELFLLHDDTLGRTSTATPPAELKHMSERDYQAVLDKDVSGLSYWDCIRHMDVGSWKGAEYTGQHPCLMTEAMALLPQGGSALCEVKGGAKDTAKAVTKLAKENGWTGDQLTFIGFDLELMAELKAGLLQSGMDSIDVIYVQAGLDEPRAIQVVLDAKAAGLDGVDFEADPKVVTPEVVRLASEHGLQTGVWVWDQLPHSDTHPTAELLERCGVDFFTSDLPPAMSQWVCAC